MGENFVGDSRVRSTLSLDVFPVHVTEPVLIRSERVALRSK